MFTSATRFPSFNYTNIKFDVSHLTPVRNTNNRYKTRMFRLGYHTSHYFFKILLNRKIFKINLIFFLKQRISFRPTFKAKRELVWKVVFIYVVVITQIFIRLI